MNGTFQRSQSGWDSARGKQEAEGPSPESHEVCGSGGHVN